MAIGGTQAVVKVSKDDSDKCQLLAYWEGLNVLALKDICGMKNKMNMPSSQINQNAYIHTLQSYSINRNCQLSCVMNHNF